MEPHHHSCPHHPQPEESGSACGAHNVHTRVDWLLTGSLFLIIPSYLLWLALGDWVQTIPYVHTFTHTTYEVFNAMWWGLALGIFSVGVLSQVPREFITSALGRSTGMKGILRATAAGIALDLCSHGILLVGMKLYERGATLGQVMAFLIASPWNSLSLTLVLWALAGFEWMLAFVLLSMVIAITSGLIFEKLVEKNILPANPNRPDTPADFAFFREAGKRLRHFRPTPGFLLRTLKQGILESRMVVRWLLFGIVLAALVRTFVPPEIFSGYFGPSLVGLALSLLAATVMEVCSEGAMPVATDLLTRAQAPGNAFAFLMAGVSTDYTEIMGLKETTGSWRIALFLPLVTLPQVIFLGWLLNQLSG